MINSQIMPPKIKNYIRRSRLIEMGMSIRTHHITYVAAPAGYGKSVLISSLIDEPGWPGTAWLSLDHHDLEMSFFVMHIIYSVKKIVPHFGDNVIRTVKSLQDIRRDWNIPADILIEELSAEDETVLVFDDFHLIEQNHSICKLMEYLICQLPEFIHIVIISRNKSGLNLSRELIKGQLLEITGRELQFNQEETERLFKEMNLVLDNKTFEVIQSVTEGWAAALKLFVLLLVQSDLDINKALSIILKKEEILYKYLSNEILSYLSGNYSKFLLGISLLPYVEPGLCNASLAIENSESMINDLHSMGLLSISGEENSIWKLHHLVGEFMQAEATACLSKEHISGIRKRAASYLETLGSIELALEMLLINMNFAEAAELIKKHGDVYFLQHGRMDSLNAKINCLPIDLVSKDQWLLFYLGTSILHVNQQQSVELFSKAADTAYAMNDTACYLRSLLAVIPVYTFSNNLKKLHEISDRIKKIALHSGDAWAKNIALVGLLGNIVWSDDVEKGLEICAMVDKNNLDSESRMQFLFASSMLLHRTGNLSSAKEKITEALALPYVKENERWTGTALVIYAFICMLSGEHEELKGTLDETIRIAEKYNIPHQQGLAYRRKAHLLQLNGSFGEAKKNYEISTNAFQRYNNIFMTRLNDLDIIMLRILAGEDTEEMFITAREAMKKLTALPGGQGLDDYAQSVFGTIAMEAGHFEMARDIFIKLEAICISKGAGQTLAGTRFLLARVYLLLKNYESADCCLAKALAMSEVEKWEFFWDWHNETMFFLCQYAIVKNIHPAWAAHLLFRWFPQRACQQAINLLTYPNDVINREFSSLLQQNAMETRIPTIHIKCLGGFRIFVNGLEITEDAWKTKKIENLAKYLLINRQYHRKENLIEQFWPESSPKLGDTSLRNALTHIRKVLGLNEYIKEIVIVKNQMVKLDTSVKVYTDYELFEQTAQNALAKNSTGMDLLEQAEKLYLGEFLPDNMYDDWSANKRYELQQLYLAVLERLIELYLNQNMTAPALKLCLKYLDINPFEESVCRKAMLILWNSGQKHQAIVLFKKLCSKLDEEYGIKPTLETIELYKKIYNES